MEKKLDDLRQEALVFTKELVKQYFEMRELDALPQFMDEHTSWIGTGDNEISRNLEEAKETLRKEFAEYSGTFRIEKQWFEAIPRSASICVVYGEIQVIPEDVELSNEVLRLSLVLDKTEQGMKIVHIHLSHYDQEQEQGRYFVSKTARSNTKDLRRTLDLRSRQLDILNQNIPGGAHQCKNDRNFTLISMSDSFLSMFGYTREDVETIFHNHFIEMIYPSDRAAVLACVHEQLKTTDNIELEYRVLCKNGTPVWIMDRGRLLDNGEGGKNFFCLLIEISERRKEQEALRLSLERHQIIVDQATDIIFEWDIAKDTLNFSPNWYKKFGYDAITTKISERIPLSKNIHPNDMQAFVEIMEDTIAGVPYSETEFRIRDNSKYYCWCRIRATAQFDSDGCTIKAVGVIVDIDSEKRQKQTLLDMAQMDALTGLYNKTTINTLVDLRMEDLDPNAKQALLILDVDYFKSVNDIYGHLAGDSILSDVATVINSNIRETGLSGRIGGDEFLIYLPDVLDENELTKKVDKLLEALEVLIPATGAAPITCSIGVAVCSSGAMDYYTLYKCADKALYARKKSGRKGATFYQEGMNEVPLHDIDESAVGTDVGDDYASVVNGQLAQYSFRMLYAAKDIESTLNRLLEIIGRSYDVSRAYIFENSEDDKYCSNTFEWCADGVESQISSLQNISYLEDIEDYQANFDHKGLFYCAEANDMDPKVRAILEPQGIRSMLQCAMLDEGAFVGYVGFDECRENRSWSTSNVEAFKLTADVLSTFLVKLRHKQK